MACGSISRNRTSVAPESSKFQSASMSGRLVDVNSDLLSDDHVYEAARDYDYVADLFAVQHLGHLFALQRHLLEYIICCVGRHGQAVSDLAVDLNDERNLLVGRDSGIKFRPLRAICRAQFPQLLPELVRQVRSEGRHEQD